MLLKNEIINILKQHGLWLSKSLGQHFLADEQIYNKIIYAANLESNHRVLEIGAGLGHLTERLASQCAHVISVEVDSKCLAILHERLARFSNVTILNEDIRRISLQELCPPPSWIVVANIPYYLSSFLLRMFIDNRQIFSSFVLMLQKEVAERLTALPGTKSYGILSVLAQAFMEPELIATVPNSVFIPPPQVQSAIVKLSAKPALIPEQIVPVFFNLVKTAFAQRRKTLRNNLKGFMEMTQQQLEQIAKETGIELGRRGETLSVNEFLALSQATHNKTKNMHY